MIRSSDFNSAVAILDRFVEPKAHLENVRFSDDYAGQPVLEATLKILHKAGAEGSECQRAQLSLARHKIEKFNAILADLPSLQAVQDALGFQGDVGKWQGIQIELPPTRCEKIVHAILVIPHIVVSVCLDIAMLPIALLLLAVAALVKPHFDPLCPKRDKTPILLLHGSGFNEIEWILGRQFLKKESYGSVFSLNYAGLVSNNPDKGIDDYAAGKVRQKIGEIQKLTGQKKIILIGHSMGGDIGVYYAEHFADEDGVEVEGVITIASPWKGSPLLRYKKSLSKRYRQMSENSSFLRDLVARALCSEKAGLRKYYSIGSSADLMVPASSSLLTEDLRRQRTFSWLGHYGLIASPSLWLQIRSWLDAIYLRSTSSSGVPSAAAPPR